MQPLPPPPQQPLPPPPAEASPPARRSGAWAAVAAVAALLSFGITSLVFVVVAYGDDPDATRTAGSMALVFIGLEAIAAAVFAFVAWIVAWASSDTLRRVVWGLVLAAAGFWGLVTGYLGVILIALERHPVKDEA